MNKPPKAWFSITYASYNLVYADNNSDSPLEQFDKRGKIT
jgi:hypothetical protein